jgi:hypothetical protein
MKSTLIKTLQAIAIGILLVASPLCAQVDHQFTMQVPFDFSAGNQLFSAGDYIINLNFTGTVVIRRRTGRLPSGTYSAGKRLYALQAGLQRTVPTSFLSQVWPPGNGA